MAIELDFPKIGNMAPAFSLENQKGEKISLKDYKGKKTVVIYFYPRAMTPGCTVQAQGIRDSKRTLTSKNIVVLGMSPDPVAKLEKFRIKEKLNFDLLSDEDHKIADKYGVWAEKKFMGKTYDGIHRITFIVGKDGKLKHIMKKVATKSHHEDVINYIKENI
jgi:peroxiredoxin Q/BCP